ncbi:Dam family site-specific DNA-(adenine-N6)-methyltransferase [Nocardioides sp.]|uniref:DNA adenine methylase n=1 Tax=Nocardioides sp. TaxID=35761 RepID=UPI0026311DEC|nr:Dam family site-specific DNA-(adenine-N6)-methyltransferase [Nocardioides sp.]MDI6909819.1 Dam family site-specific DNA-(adenine-N6)-methyltransferase [Nocardioides sp.]
MAHDSQQAPELPRELPASQVQPFLRWAGSKRWLAARIKSILPAEFGDYYEPFLGSGSVFFALGLDGNRCVLSDSLSPLINCFEQVRDQPSAVHEAVANWGCDRESYYAIRGLKPTDDATRAAQFIYLNRLCFNGLYRVNRDGGFNVPYGRPRFERIFSKPNELHAPSKRLNGTRIHRTDFVSATERATQGDLVYLDPPYVAGHRNNGFVDYNARVFRWEDQRRLSELCDSLTARGVMVIVSNADHPSIRELYGSHYRIESLNRFSSMSGNAGARGVSQELLIVNGPLVEAIS